LQGQGNVVVSPFSVYSVLFWLWLGAKGKTNETMTRVLKVSQQARLDGMEPFYDPNVFLGNRIYITDQAGIKDNRLAEYLERVDFSDVKTADKINRFVYEKTNGKIPKFLDSPTFSDDTAMFLLNSLYFKGQWKASFSDYFKGRFTNYDGSKSNVQFMTADEPFNHTYLHDYKTFVVEIPYVGTEVVMILCLPDSIPAFDYFIKNLNEIKDKVFNQRNGLLDMELTIPKFNLKSTTTLDPILKKMGMEIAYTQEADFSGIIDKPVKISEAKQKAIVEVDRHGTEAAAVSTVQVLQLSGPTIQTFDNPFVFFLFHKPKQIPLMAGVVRNLPNNQAKQV